MMNGNSVQERKKSLAELVKAHLESLGKKAELVFNRTNSKGHNDQVVVESEIGLIHLTTSSSIDPNAPLVTADFQDNEQEFLADKDFVVYGWRSKDKRTFLMFVNPSDLLGKNGITKQEITVLRNREFSTVLA